MEAVVRDVGDLTEDVIEEAVEKGGNEGKGQGFEGRHDSEGGTQQQRPHGHTHAQMEESAESTGHHTNGHSMVVVTPEGGEGGEREERENKGHTGARRWCPV